MADPWNAFKEAPADAVEHAEDLHKCGATTLLFGNELVCRRVHAVASMRISQHEVIVNNEQGRTVVITWT